MSARPHVRGGRRCCRSAQATPCQAIARRPDATNAIKRSKKNRVIVKAEDEEKVSVVPFTKKDQASGVASLRFSEMAAWLNTRGADRDEWTSIMSSCRVQAALIQTTCLPRRVDRSGHRSG